LPQLKSLNLQQFGHHHLVFQMSNILLLQVEAVVLNSLVAVAQEEWFKEQGFKLLEETQSQLQLVLVAPAVEPHRCIQEMMEQTHKSLV
jgi:hypothetical protein